MKRFVLGFVCALSLAVAPGCGGDDDDDGDSSGGADAAGGGGDVDAFCTSFEETCGFTDWYNSQGECVTTVEGWSTERQACVAEHLGFAAGYDEGSADRETHCGHAGGDAPCN
jgi:hypothetical protein